LSMPFPHGFGLHVPIGPSHATSGWLPRSNVAASRGPSLAASMIGAAPSWPPLPVVDWGETPAHPPRTAANKMVQQGA